MSVTYDLSHSAKFRKYIESDVEIYIGSREKEKKCESKNVFSKNIRRKKKMTIMNVYR